MRRLLLVIVSITLLNSGSGFPGGEHTDSNAITGFSVTFNFRNASYGFELSVEDVSSTPSWAQPENGKPPLLIRTAIEVSKKELAKYHPEIPSWELASVGLQPVGTSSKWYYVVSWRPKGSHFKDTFSIPVLMDGSPVKLQSKQA